MRLSPTTLNGSVTTVRLQVHRLTHAVPPASVRLCCRALLVNHGRLPCTPSHHVNIRVALLHTLTFRPHVPLPRPRIPHRSFTPITPATMVAPARIPPRPRSTPRRTPAMPLPRAADRILTTHRRLRHIRKTAGTGGDRPTTTAHTQPIGGTTLRELTSIASHIRTHPIPSTLRGTPTGGRTCH